MAQEEDDLLKDKLLQMGLQDLNAKFIINKGEKFIGYPEILAKKLGIDVNQAEKALIELKSHKEKLFSSEFERLKQLIKENPDTSVEEVALLNEIDKNFVSVYLDSSERIELTESQKGAIKGKYNAGFSITEIAEELNTSPENIREYVEENCITFNGTEGKRILEIIYRNFEKQPLTKLRDLIINKNVKLQEKICWDLEETNPKEYEEVKQYFSKFEESQSLLDKNALTLSIEDKTCIRSSSLEDIEQLSIRLNRVGRVVRNFLLQYFPDENLMQHHAEQQSAQIQNIHAEFGLGDQISHIIYRMIISDSFENLIENTKTSNEMSPKRIFKELLPLAFYKLKCSLPLDKFSQIIADLTNISLTKLDIFHLVFQMSDPVVRGLCIEHYSFSNPVPFYYPRLDSRVLNLKQKFNPHQQVEPFNRFEICKELWYSIQQFNGLVSFGLGWASWNPIGKSHLLDLMFETDFVRGSPQTSPFHLNSIDIQMTKNLFGKREKTTHESTQWAYIDCHGCSDTNVIRDICQNLDIALVHVSYSDYTQNTQHLEEDLQTIAATTKHVYVFVRDCPENHQEILQVESGRETKYFFIHNLTKCDMQLLLTHLKKLGHTILHSTTESPKLVGNNFLENLIRRYCPSNNVPNDGKLIEQIKDAISSQVQDSSENKFSFLSYYPYFIKYMLCFYEASNEVDQKKIDKLNAKCVDLQNILEHANMSKIVEHFNDILSQENSTIILLKLSLELSILSKELNFTDNTVYTLEIIWREAVLSNRYYVDKDDPDNTARNFFEKFSFSFSNHVEKGEPFELIDGDNLRFFNQDINALLSKLYEKQKNERIAIENKNRPPIVISIFGPQSSGKSTLLNYCFGCKFLTSAGRCTKGVYASLSKLSRPINHSDHFLILDTEGLDAIERGKTVQDTSCINFDRTMVLFCLAVSQAVIINVRGDIGEEMRNLLQICAYSLNKLKVSKVAAPKIFFVLNQQADPDPEKHLSSINTLLDKLNKESYLMETEGTKISDLIQVSVENVFVLPSAFNSEPINTQMSKIFDSDLFKLSPTVSFANKCADLRMSIIHQLDDAHDTKTPFNTMSEWMEMSGIIWDTIIKYQDIVKYRNTEELKCSISLHKIVNDLMNNTIYRNKEEYQNITEKLIRPIHDITKWNPPNVILEDVKKGLDEIFNQNQSRIALAFQSLSEAKIGKEIENESKQKIVKENNFEYFLQKVKNLKLARGDWDRTEMRKGDQKISNKFAEDFLAAVSREVNTVSRQTIIGEYLNKERENLSHTGIQLLANNKLTTELHNPSKLNENNFVVQLICNHVQCLKSLFHEEWCKVAGNLYDRIVGNMREIFNKEMAIVKNVIEVFLERLDTMCAEKNRSEEIGTDSDSSFEIVDQPATEESATNINPQTRVIPLKTMVSFLKMYLNPRVSTQDFDQFFNNLFEIDGVKVRKHPQTYVLFEKLSNPEHILDEEIFKRLSDTNMFGSTETIFNIKIYLSQFINTLEDYEFRVTETEYENLLKATKEKFEAGIINCPRQCPSCGKFCEKELHPNGGRCQILTGHQMCSMGGNVWNTDEDRTAVLLMCEDYMDHSPVLIPGQNMTWGEFKEKFSNEWDWDLPTDQKYVALREENYETMKIVWKKFGKEILAYYGNRGTRITFILYTSPEEIYKSLFSPIYYVCFVVDGTVMSSFIHAKRWVSDVMKDCSDVDTSKFKVIVYHGHNVKNKKCFVIFPNDCEFTSDKKSIENFLKSIESDGEKDELLAMLDGLAAATTKCRWKSGFGVNNSIVHFYTEPTKGNFDIFTAQGKCYKGCPFDFEEDIRIRMDELKIKYKCKRLINRSHPSYGGSSPINNKSQSDINLNFEKKSKRTGQVFIDCKREV